MKQPLMHRLPGWVVIASDAILTTVVTVLVQVAVWTGDEPEETFADRPLSSLILLVVTLSLMLRRRAPLAVAGVVGAGVLLQSVVTGTFAQAPALALCIAAALYSVGAHTTARRAILGGLLVAGAIQVKQVVTPPAVPDDSPFVALFWWLLVLSMVGLGAFVRSLRRSAQLQQEARSREAERAAHARAAVAEERQRIARELHDVVSHNVSASIVQAGAAEELLRTDPDRAGIALQSIQEMGREAIGEMRRLLGIMRDGDAAALAPQPRLSDLPALVGRASESGVETRLVVDGTVPDLGPGLELSAYRIVQESLTNVLRHAQARTAVVTLRYERGWLEVEITDDGRGSVAVDPGTGHGLRGLRERVEIFGGELTAGPGAAGGFVVRALLPSPGTPT